METKEITRMDPKERRTQILNAAVVLAKDKGFTELRAHDVAASAGCSYGLVARYFPGMAELRYQVMMEALRLGIAEIVAGGLACGDATARTASPQLKKKAVAILSR